MGTLWSCTGNWDTHFLTLRLNLVNLYYRSLAVNLIPNWTVLLSTSKKLYPGTNNRYKLKIGALWILMSQSSWLYSILSILLSSVDSISLLKQALHIQIVMNIVFKRQEIPFHITILSDFWINTVILYHYKKCCTVLKLITLYKPTLLTLTLFQYFISSLAFWERIIVSWM